MTKQNDFAKLEQQIENIANQLCQAVEGDFNFTISQTEEYESIQKLTMLTNFLIDSARRAVLQEKEKQKELERTLIKLETINQKMIDTSRKTGMTEVANDILSNVSNILNSVNVSAALIKDTIADSNSSKHIHKAMKLLKQNKNTFSDIPKNDKKGKQLTDYLILSADTLQKENNWLHKEAKELIKNLEQIKSAISSKQSKIKTAIIHENININEFISHIITLQLHEFDTKHINVKLELDESISTITTDKHRLLSILMNLFQNSIQSFSESKKTNKKNQVIIKTTSIEHDFIRIDIIDNGKGISSENLEHIFTEGFSTIKSRKGYGLHSSLISANALGGTLKAFSKGEGKGKGSTFCLKIPKKNK